ncbi:OmpA family protein [Sphingomonas arantia]|uniref:OmpA family protein n=1 Tax=Sphingomonas arantia TaxID=1460676 RepID=A0ABW4U3F1_9SPHN
MLTALLLAITVEHRVLLPAPLAPAVNDPFVVFFRTGDATVTTESRQILDNFVRAVRNDRTLGITILGHADRAEGPLHVTLPLSERRAAAVRRYLLSAGIPVRIVHARAMGTAFPITRSPNVVNQYVSIAIDL